MNIWSFYDKTNGMIAPWRFSGPPSSLPQNTAKGYEPISGTYDHMSQRFDLKSKKVVDYVPDKPAATEFIDYRWNPLSKRWESFVTPAGERAQENELLAVRMKQVEARQQRALRDVAIAAALGSKPPDAAVQALLEVERDIAALRAQLR